MKASILITSLNYEHFVGHTIESALNQTYPNVEVVVADDGSEDRSPEVIRSFEPRIKVVLKQNGGQASAINAAWRLSTGDVIFFLDSDDILKPDAVERVMKAWKPGISKIHFRLDVTDADLRPLGYSIPRATLAEGDLKSQVLDKGVYVSPPASGNAFSRRFLEAVMPIPEADWRFGAETHPVFLAPLFGQIGAIHESLGYYRTHATSFTGVSGRMEPRKIRNLLQIDINLRKTLEEYAGRLGYPLTGGASLTHWLHYKIRLASCKMCGPQHPFPEDRAFGVASQLIRAAWAAPELSAPFRAAFTAWAVAVAGLPASATEPLIRMAFSPSQRPAILRRLMGGGN